MAEEEKTIEGFIDKQLSRVQKQHSTSININIRFY